VTAVERRGPEASDISCRTPLPVRWTVVAMGVITGEGPPTKGPSSFLPRVDADDAAWCARILTASAVEHQPVSRAEPGAV